MPRQHGSAIKATLTRQEFKRLDALFQTKALAEEMRQGERLLEKFVADARKAGATWSEIGTSLGVSQQAASARFGKNNARPTQRQVRPRKPAVPVTREVQESLSV
jgi:hypothetical protein